MTVAPTPGQVSGDRPGRSHGPLAKRAVRFASVCGVAFAASIGTIATLHAVGAESAVEDTLLGAVLLVVAFVGLLGSLAAFAMAIDARRHERWTLLWLPLLLFPAIVAFVVLGEALWWE
jgi:heme/copper-type cytochrome/quinol oxidase subunit 4